MHGPVDSRQSHSLVGEDLAPFAERLIPRNQQGSAFIAGGDQVEQHTGLGLILGDDRREGGEPRTLCCLPNGEVAIPRQMFQETLRLIAELRPQPQPAPA
jgi:hypothetical protein